MTCIEETDGFHVIITQREVEEVDVLLHSLYMSGLGDDDDTVLDKELQGYLNLRPPVPNGISVDGVNIIKCLKKILR